MGSVRVVEGDRVELSTRRGDDLDVAVKYYDSSGVQVDVSGWEAAFSVWEDGRLLVRVSTDPGPDGRITTGVNGFVATVVGAATDLLPERAWQEFRFRDLAGKVKTLFEGPLVVGAQARDGVFSV